MAARIGVALQTKNSEVGRLAVEEATITDATHPIMTPGIIHETSGGLRIKGEHEGAEWINNSG